MKPAGDVGNRFRSFNIVIETPTGSRRISKGLACAVKSQVEQRSVPPAGYVERFSEVIRAKLPRSRHTEFKPVRYSEACGKFLCRLIHTPRLAVWLGFS